MAKSTIRKTGKNVSIKPTSEKTISEIGQINPGMQIPPTSVVPFVTDTRFREIVLEKKPKNMTLYSRHIGQPGALDPNITEKMIHRIVTASSGPRKS